MAGLMMRRLAQTPSSLLLKTLTRTLAQTLNHSALSSNSLLNHVSRVRSYLSASTPAAFDENLLRIIRSEISYLSDYRPPLKPVSSYKSFAIQDNPGENWIRLKSTFESNEEIKIDATLFDGVANPNPNSDPKPELHISLIVEVSRGGSVFGFICSAWPDLLVVQKVLPIGQNGTAVTPYLGPDLRDLDDEEAKRSVREFLEKRGVNDEMAVFLHKYMLNKDKVELIRWLKTIESYVEK